MSRIRSSVSVNQNVLSIELEGLDTVERALGDLKSKSPAAAKVAINAAARAAKKLMIAKAQARYAVNAAGKRHLKDLKQTVRATNKSLSAKLYIQKLSGDLGYFTTDPPYPTYYSGGAWRHGPDVWSGKVLNESSMEPLDEGTDDYGRKVSKGFAVKFKSGHIGMVQRLIGVKAQSETTARGYTRWTNKKGVVEDLRTMRSPSAAAMHKKAWYIAEPEIEEYLLERLDAQVQRVLARAGRA